jgi:Class III cytochrome C family
VRRWVVALAVLVCAVAVAGPAPTATHFSHADHAQRGVAIDTCETCHDVDAKGQVSPPAALGHSPCQSVACHAAYFVGVGAKAGKADPARYAKATAFCLGCHDSKDGAPPSPWQKPTTNAALRSFQYEREYHVEMNHFEHTHRTECGSCHVVDDKSFALVGSAPGHAQCVTCHSPQKSAPFTMSKCGICHDKPARAEFFQVSRPQTDVRACGSEGHAALEARLHHAVSCFRHERAEHRTAEGKALSCAACHYMVGDKSKWGEKDDKPKSGSRTYQSLKDLHTQPVIDNSQDREHKSCGQSTACHQVDVDAARAGAKCSLCHAEKSAF